MPSTWCIAAFAHTLEEMLVSRIGAGGRAHFRSKGRRDHETIGIQNPYSSEKEVDKKEKPSKSKRTSYNDVGVACFFTLGCGSHEDFLHSSRGFSLLFSFRRQDGPLFLQSPVTPLKRTDGTPLFHRHWARCRNRLRCNKIRIPSRNVFP
ncbi:uncharacterized protein TM35_000022250 [Trypanosoma theileri]|uniref:Uncharacterized protein n=1 Tax=Trypanosoma theileri TaxID=67003 RepID=A0A1X0P8I9_9TRYP|nr:uncharacterized protein TM35_000022250 [Trypanosoma theileri]ORC92899.1 hypothetical protein TM35_000022250 [Trypanosoma theileri]